MTPLHNKYRLSELLFCTFAACCISRHQRQKTAARTPKPPGCQQAWAGGQPSVECAVSRPAHAIGQLGPEGGIEPQHNNAYIILGVLLICMDCDSPCHGLDIPLPSTRCLHCRLCSRAQSNTSLQVGSEATAVTQDVSRTLPRPMQARQVVGKGK